MWNTHNFSSLSKTLSLSPSTLPSPLPPSLPPSLPLSFSPSLPLSLPPSLPPSRLLSLSLSHKWKQTLEARITSRRRKMLIKSRNRSRERRTLSLSPLLNRSTISWVSTRTNPQNRMRPPYTSICEGEKADKSQLIVIYNKKEVYKYRLYCASVEIWDLDTPRGLEISL